MSRLVWECSFGFPVLFCRSSFNIDSLFLYVRVYDHPKVLLSSSPWYVPFGNTEWVVKSLSCVCFETDILCVHFEIPPLKDPRWDSSSSVWLTWLPRVLAGSFQVATNSVFPFFSVAEWHSLECKYQFLFVPWAVGGCCSCFPVLALGSSAEVKFGGPSLFQGEVCAWKRPRVGVPSQSPSFFRCGGTSRLLNTVAGNQFY